MFEPCSRIGVIESSVRKKTGPKKGSIGYVARVQSHLSIQHIANGIVTSLMPVVFTRFGHEKKRRLERKTVIVIMPMAGLKKIENQCESLVSLMNSKDFDPVASYVRSVYNINEKSDVPILFSAPLNSIDGDTEVEMKAWLECFLNGGIGSFAHQAFHERHYENATFNPLSERQIWETVSLSIDNKSLRKEVMGTIMSDVSKSLDLLLSFKAMLCMEGRKRSHNTISGIYGTFLSSFSDYPKPHPEMLYSPMIDSIFSPTTIAAVAGATKDINNGASKAFNENFNRIISESLELSARVCDNI